MATDDTCNAKQQAKKKENEVIELLDDSDDEEEDDEMDISDDDDSQQQEDDINPTQKSEITDQEQLSLKLAELKAKAKLARAKLRIAEQKKAKGTRNHLIHLPEAMLPQVMPRHRPHYHLLILHHLHHPYPRCLPISRH